MMHSHFSILQLRLLFIFILTGLVFNTSAYALTPLDSIAIVVNEDVITCLLYTSDAADDLYTV